MVWLGSGEGSWSVQQVGNFGYGGIEVGDLNLDGNLDVVWGGLKKSRFEIFKPS